MKTQWDAIYLGPHTNQFLKKLQRQLAIEITSVEKERIIWDGKKLERATFLMSHQNSEWGSLVLEILSLTQKICWHWELNLDLPNSISGNISLNPEKDVNYPIEAPADLQSLSWVLKKDQVYAPQFCRPPTFFDKNH